MKKNLKKMIAVVASTTMLIGMMPADSIKYVGVINAAGTEQTSDGWSFDETTGTLTITTDSGTTAWRDSCDVALVKSVVIQEGVTSIGDNAFYDCSGLTSITIPNDVTSIGNDAFYGCSGLTSITIPNDVTSIGYRAFSDCSSLTSITIPDKVTYIKDEAFAGCSGLTSITIPNDVTSIGNGAFYGCSGLTSITIPNDVTSIGYRAFSDCSSLTSITIPDKVTYIKDEAFAGCSGLTSITIPDKVTYIGYYAFSGCSGLTSITIPNDVTYIGYSAFSGCSGLTSITIPDNITTIESNAFFNCSNLTEINVSENNNAYCSVDGVLFNKDKTKLICFPAGKSDSEYSILDNVTFIDEMAFIGCSNLTGINVSDSNNAYCSIDGVLFNKDKIELICFPAGKNVSEYSIPDGITTIKDGAFMNCSNLTSVTISDSVINISLGVFYDCLNLAEINVSENNNEYCSVDGVLFNKDKTELICFPAGKNVSEYSIPDGVMYIKGGAFMNCSNLTSITIPNGVTSIDYMTFANCSGLTSIEIPDSVEYIQPEAFAGCSSITSITIPASVRFIDYDAFDDCQSLDNIIYPEHVYMGYASVPDTATHVRYTVDGDNINITDIILGKGKDRVELPETMNGKSIVHTHTGGMASCSKQAICEKCGIEYGEFLAHQMTKTEAVAPTCTTEGNMEYYHCSECDGYFRDEKGENKITLADTVRPITHKYDVDGKCTICGTYKNGIGERLKGYSLSLSGNIGVNFYMALDKSVLEDKNAHMVFDFQNNNTISIPVSEAEMVVDNGNTYYVFSCEIPAKSIYDIIYAQIITSDKEGEKYSFTVHDYAKYIFDHSSMYSSEIVQIANTMMNYGYYALTHFNGGIQSSNAGVKAVADKMEAVTAENLAGFEKKTSGKLPKGITYHGSSLLLKSNTTVRHYFKVASGTDVSAYKFDGQKDGYYYKEISEISARNLGVAQNVKIGDYTISYSPMSYAYSVLSSKNVSGSLKNVVKALYLYEQAAKAYIS